MISRTYNPLCGFIGAIQIGRSRASAMHRLKKEERIDKDPHPGPEDRSMLIMIRTRRNRLIWRPAKHGIHQLAKASANVCEITHDTKSTTAAAAVAVTRTADTGAVLKNIFFSDLDVSKLCQTTSPAAVEGGDAVTSTR
jgi:hypothetical protein